VLTGKTFFPQLIHRAVPLRSDRGVPRSRGDDERSARWPRCFNAGRYGTAEGRGQRVLTGRCDAGHSPGYPAGMTTTDDRPREVRNQARRHADAAREAADEKRREAGDGLVGWIAERAGEWDLGGQDEATMQRQKFLWNALVDYWFRMEMDGWDKPARIAGPAGGHSFRCGRSYWDAWTGRGAVVAPLRAGTAATRNSARRVDGDPRHREVLPRDGSATGRARLDCDGPGRRQGRGGVAGRRGSTRCGRGASVTGPTSRAGRASSRWRSVPECPSCRSPRSVAPIAMPVLMRGDGLSRALRLDKVLRLKVFPTGDIVAVGYRARPRCPQLPLPAKIRTRFMPAVEVDPTQIVPTMATTWTRCMARCRQASSGAWNALARKRALPLFG